jgi:hypothetical protein
MTNAINPEFARGIPVPFEPDRVLSPELIYRHEPTDALYYVTGDDEPVRITFEGLDSIRACRGEYMPYPTDESAEAEYTSVYIVENSRWLRERHAYEARYYRDCYKWGGDVDVMLTDYDHYLFQFHDEYIEAIAAGIWSEKQPTPFTDGSLGSDHPLADLPETATTERFVVEGLTCQVRANPRPIGETLQGAYYCSQPLYHFALELDGDARVSNRLDVRERRGRVRSVLRGIMGTVMATLDGVATLDQSRALVEPYVREVAERRRSMH